MNIAALTHARRVLAPAVIAVLFMGASFMASANPVTVTLAIPSMDCPVCPITLKKALSKVHGVTKAEVNYEMRQAVVVFDDTKTNVGALIESTKNAGYPSKLVEAEN